MATIEDNCLICNENAAFLRAAFLFLNDTLIFVQRGLLSVGLAGFGVFLDSTGEVPMGIPRLTWRER
jgi:hypothetical protein